MDEKYEIRIIRSRRRTLQVEIGQDLGITVRVPNRCSRREIDAFIESERGWIDKHLEKMKQRIDNVSHVEKYSDNEIRALSDMAYYYIPPRVEEYAQKIGVKYGHITIRCQKTRWGSCSSKGNLNFNCLLMALDEKIRDYVIIHELCHLIHPNHSPEFWKEVEKYCPDHRALRKQLKENGTALFLRL